MNKKLQKFFIFLLLTAFGSCFGQQSVFLKLGSNITQYQYTETNLTMRSEPGGSYEAGYKAHINKSSYPGLYYSVGLVVNNFNQVAGSSTSLYRWKATYMGINGNIGFRVYQNRENNLKANFVFGTAVSKFVNGTQITNSSLYDLKGSPDFDKVFIQPSFGLETVYNINNDMMISLGYHYSRTFNLTPNGSENLNFSNSNFFIGTYIEL